MKHFIEITNYPTPFKDNLYIYVKIIYTIDNNTKGESNEK